MKVTKDLRHYTAPARGSKKWNKLYKAPTGHYFARVQFEGSRPPATITIRNTSDNPISRKNVTSVDFITASAANNTDTQILRIDDSPSDAIGSPVLSTEDFGDGVI